MSSPSNSHPSHAAIPDFHCSGEIPHRPGLGGSGDATATEPAASCVLDMFPSNKRRPLSSAAPRLYSPKVTPCEQITLAILAGGRGSRMGKPKSHLRLHGRPILEYLLQRLAWPGPKLL